LGGIKLNACAVCGEISATHNHIVPKALALDLRAGAKNLNVITVDERRVGITQSGFSARGLLCATHERQLNQLDTYGVSIVRAVSNLQNKSGISEAAKVANPQPDLLTRFLLSVAWRFDRNQILRKEGSFLGEKYADLIRGHLFEGAPFQTQIALVRPQIVVGDDIADITSSPTRAVMENINIVTLYFGRLEAIIKLDQRKAPQILVDLDCTNKDPLTVVVSRPTDIRTIQRFRPLFDGDWDVPKSKR
jgi:hypothetical protein